MPKLNKEMRGDVERALAREGVTDYAITTRQSGHQQVEATIAGGTWRFHFPTSPKSCGPSRKNVVTELRPGCGSFAS